MSKTVSELTPKNFGYPWGSIFRNCETETIAANVMVILGRTGNTFRDLSWDEYMVERKKDSGFSEIERGYFEKVKPYCMSPEMAMSFSPTWMNEARKEMGLPELKRDDG